MGVYYYMMEGVVQTLSVRGDNRRCPWVFADELKSDFVILVDMQQIGIPKPCLPRKMELVPHSLWDCESSMFRLGQQQWHLESIREGLV